MCRVDSSDASDRRQNFADCGIGWDAFKPNCTVVDVGEERVLVGDFASYATVVGIDRKV